MGTFTHPRADGPMPAAGALQRGREAFTRHDWASAYELLSAASPLEPDDLECLATTSHLIGKDTESEGLWARAHHELLRRGDAPRAVRAAFWLAYGLFERGEHARAGGWLARARSLLGEGAHECVEQGYLLLPAGRGHIAEGDAAAAYATFCQAADIGERYADADLIALARHSCGRALIRIGEVGAGVALLDEAMAAVEASVLSPLVVGEVYCSVIEGCLEIFDVRRAQEWTTSLTQWCESQPDLVPYRGECLVRRAEILQLHGAWAEASAAARQACDQLGRGHGRPAAGAAFYQLGELHRLRGELVRAEDAFREAGRWRRQLQPGLALLRLSQGHGDAAVAGIQHALDEARDLRTRSRLLPAQVEIMLAAGRVEPASAAAAELAGIAAQLGASLLHAAATQAQGAVLLAQGDASAALRVLQHAWSAWQEIGVPYEAARVCEAVSLSCRATGDHDAADVHLAAARRIYQQLGAAVDLDRMEQRRGSESAGAPGKLTLRELQVLRHLAAGKTNRGIAAELVISERTVDRHVSNILSRLGVRSRTAAAAYAYEHGLVPSPRGDGRS